MTVDSSDGDPDRAKRGRDVSLSDVARILRRRWRVVALLTGAVTVLTAVYHTTRAGTHRATMLLEGRDYEIRFASHTRALYPFMHHKSVGESTQFVAVVMGRMRADGLIDGDTRIPDPLFTLREADKKTGPIVVAAYMSSDRDALRAARIWKEEYLKNLPSYRARKILFDMEREQSAKTQEETEAGTVIKRLEGEWAAMRAPREPRDPLRAVIAERIAALKVEREVRAYAGEFQAQVRSRLSELVAGAPLDESATAKGDAVNLRGARTAADGMVRAGLDGIFSLPTVEAEGARMSSKIFSMFLTAFMFFSMVVVLVEWIRAPSGGAKVDEPVSVAPRPRDPERDSGHDMSEVASPPGYRGLVDALRLRGSGTYVRRWIHRMKMSLPAGVTAWSRGEPLFSQLDYRARHPILVNQPLVLISQIQRSGGTLLSQLFDGHPGLHAYPHEFHQVKRRGTSRWLALLNERPDPSVFLHDNIWKFREGYFKVTRGLSEQPPRASHQRPLLLSWSVFRSIYTEQRRCGRTSRDAANAFFTAFFNAWLNNANLEGHKTHVTCFAPFCMRREEDIAAFFQIYEDGHLIHILREPVSWYASAKKHSGKYADAEEAIDLWCAQVALHVSAAQRRKNVHIISFEQLIENTEGVMRALCRAIGMEFNAALLTPTFNRGAILSDSSFDVSEGVINKKAADRSKQVESHEREIIARKAVPLYDKARASAAFITA